MIKGKFKKAQFQADLRDLIQDSEDKFVIEYLARSWLEGYVRRVDIPGGLEVDPDGKDWTMAVDALALLDCMEAFAESVPAVTQWLVDVTENRVGPVKTWARWTIGQIKRNERLWRRPSDKTCSHRRRAASPRSSRAA
jgi:hypothetical protein